MKYEDLIQTLYRLRNLPAETEVVEFKEAKNNYDFSDLGKYFSALCNEANLKNKPYAWLVFGVEDKKHQIVGSNYRPHRKDLDNLKKEIADHTTHRITITFLNKAKITIKGKITRAAILLLGKEESEHFLVSADAKIRWVLKTLDNQNKDYEIFTIPFLLAVDKVYSKIRNLKYRYLPDGTLFPNEVLRYEPFVIRESLNNAIAHQDYTKAGRINVIEYEDDHLIFTNLGNFIPGTVENVIENNAPEEHYRNKFLAMAMFNLNLVDTIGSGIIKMFHAQKNKFFPLPDYDISNEKVKVTIIGKILDMDYARLLAQNPNLSLEDIIMLDKVQKKTWKKISEDEIRYLRKRKFIEGRKNNYYLSYRVAKPTEDEKLISEYVTNKSFDDDYFKKLILEYITRQGKTRRKAIDNFIIPKLSTVLSDKQKKDKVTNYLSALRMNGKIESTAYAIWEVKRI